MLHHPVTQTSLLMRSASRSFLVRLSQHSFASARPAQRCVGQQNPSELLRYFSAAGGPSVGDVSGSTYSARSDSKVKPQSRASEPYTHFGFTSVPLSAKERLVRGVFENVAPSYDVMNDAMSLAVHRAWKSAFVADLRPTPEMKIVDCAGGTGDIALRILEARAKGGHRPPGRPPCGPVVVCDINPEMLRVGRERARARGLTGSDLEFVEADAEKLPFEDESMDAYVISFGMRNVPRPEVALAEAVRVLKPGGRFMMLEFAQVKNPVVSAAYDAYSFNVIPILGKFIAGDKSSYDYLVESIRQFPGQAEFSGLMRNAGLRNVTVKDYTFGIAAQYSGFKSVERSSPTIMDKADPDSPSASK